MRSVYAVDGERSVPLLVLPSSPAEVSLKGNPDDYVKQSLVAPDTGPLPTSLRASSRTQTSHNCILCITTRRRHWLSKARGLHNTSPDGLPNAEKDEPATLVE
jgi:hypothetical protein